MDRELVGARGLPNVEWTAQETAKPRRLKPKLPELCDLRQGMESLCASVVSSVKWTH